MNTSNSSRLRSGPAVSHPQPRLYSCADLGRSAWQVLLCQGTLVAVSDELARAAHVPDSIGLRAAALAPYTTGSLAVCHWSAAWVLGVPLQRLVVARSPCKDRQDADPGAEAGHSVAGACILTDAAAHTGDVHLASLRGATRGRHPRPDVALQRAPIDPAQIMAFPDLRSAGSVQVTDAARTAADLLAREQDHALPAARWLLMHGALPALVESALKAAYRGTARATALRLLDDLVG